MVILKIDNSMSRIEGLTNTQASELKKLLSYKVPGSFFGGQHRSRDRALIDRHGLFPSGLMYLVLDYLSGKLYTIVDSRMRPNPTPGMFKLRK